MQPINLHMYKFNFQVRQELHLDETIFRKKFYYYEMHIKKNINILFFVDYYNKFYLYIFQ